MSLPQMLPDAHDLRASSRERLLAVMPLGESVSTCWILRRMPGAVRTTVGVALLRLVLDTDAGLRGVSVTRTREGRVWRYTRGAYGQPGEKRR